MQIQSGAATFDYRIVTAPSHFNLFLADHGLVRQDLSWSQVKFIASALYTLSDCDTFNPTSYLLYARHPGSCGGRVLPRAE
jgi:hypothetical protein